MSTHSFWSLQVYISETASPKQRGAMGSVNQLGITIGILLAYAIGDSFTWRQSALAGAGPAALLVVLMLFMPETARWLLSHGKEEKARENLQWLRGPHWDTEKEICEIQQSLGKTLGNFRISQRQLELRGIFRNLFSHNFPRLDENRLCTDLF